MPTGEKKLELLGLDLQELTDIMGQVGEPDYRARQIYEAVYGQRLAPLLTSGTSSECSLGRALGPCLRLRASSPAHAAAHLRLQGRGLPLEARSGVGGHNQAHEHSALDSGDLCGKDRVLARMRIPKPGPGYMHLPEWATDEYLEQLTGEKKITVRDRRTRTRKPLYVKTYPRNEALDLTVYCHAALFILQHFIEPSTYRDLGRLAALVQQGHAPGSLVPLRLRRVRSPGLS